MFGYSFVEEEKIKLSHAVAIIEAATVEVFWVLEAGEVHDDSNVTLVHDDSNVTLVHDDSNVTLVQDDSNVTLV